MNAARRAISLSAFAALVLMAVWLFWPMALGGGTTYVSTHGISMEPEFSTGDLGVLRSADGYAVGDVVAYHDDSLDTIVMHRIVSGDADGFVTQGDNNDWLDEVQPSQDEILGSLFFRVPQGGKALDALISPGALVFLVGGLLIVFGNAHRPRGRRAARRRGARPSPAVSMPARARARQVALGSAVTALVALAGGAVLLVLPSTQTDTRTLQVTQDGEFSYTGAAVPGTTYPTGVIATGDTVWTKLAREVTVSFTDTVTGRELTDLRGSVRLDVSVTAGDGWSAVLNSGPVVPLENGKATATVVIDPLAAAAQLNRHYAEIGAAGGAATLTVTPVVEATGRAGGQSFTAAPPDALDFTLDASALRPGSTREALSPRVLTDVEVHDVVTRRLPVLAFSVPIDVARIVTFGVLAVALVTLAAAAWIGRTAKGDVADQFLVRHADRILPVAAFTSGPTVIDVSDAESLHRVAERFDTVVLHHADVDEDVFVVRDGDATYRLVLPGLPNRQRGKPPVPPPVLAAVPTPLDLTAPMPAVQVPRSDVGGLRGRLA